MSDSMRSARGAPRQERKAGSTVALVGSAAAIVGAGIAAMATGSVPVAAPQSDHSDVQTATLTQATIAGTGNAGFATPPAPIPSTPSLNGSPAPKNTPVIPGVTQDTTSSTNNPGGNSFPFLPLTTQAGIAPTPSGLALNPSTSNNDPLGFGNFGIAPAGRVTFNSDGTTIVNPGGFFALSTPLGGGSSSFGFPVTIDNQGNAKFTAWDNFLSGIANLPDLKNTTNTTGFASDQPANPNFDTNAPFGGSSFVDPLSKQTFDNLTNAVNTIQANDFANAVNSLNVPTMQQLFPNGFPGDTTSSSLPGVPGPSAVITPQDFANIDAMFPNSVNSFAPVNTLSGIPAFQQAYQAGLAAENGAGGDAGTGATRGIIITNQVPVVYPDGSTSYFDSGTTAPQFVPQGSTVGGTTYNTSGAFSGPSGEPIIVTPAAPPDATPGKSGSLTGDGSQASGVTGDPNGTQKVASASTTMTDADPASADTQQPPPPPQQQAAASPTSDGTTDDTPGAQPPAVTPPAPTVVATNYYPTDPTSFGDSGGGSSA